MSDNPAGTDPSTAYANLRKESAALLGLDPGGSWTALQEMQLDLVSLLRLEVDGMQGQQLAGQPVDLTRLAVAFGMLQKLLPQKLEAEPAKQDVADDARTKLAGLLDGLSAAAEHEWADACSRESEAAAMSPPAPALPGPPAPARTTYIDHAVVDPAPPPTPTPPQQSSDAEWARWYRSGAGDTGHNVHGIPKGW
jgi:hypothetical protein